MKKIKSGVLSAMILVITCLALLTGCGKNYCSYGGCMNEVESEGGRCSSHQGLENNPYYGIPKPKN